MPSAFPTVYDVISRRGSWRMIVNEREFGSFKSEQHAVRIAIETAYEAGRFNVFGAVVILHGLDQIARVVWTYGHDPFPPSSFE